MTDQDGIKPKQDNDKDHIVNQEEGDTEKKTARFCIESDEMIDDAERERLKRDAKKYEAVVDRLFDEDDCPESTEE
jgi:hypothetical protein